MTPLSQIIRRCSIAVALGALAVSLATYGTATTLLDASRNAPCADRLMKSGDLEKESDLAKDLLDKASDLGINQF